MSDKNRGKPQKKKSTINIKELTAQMIADLVVGIVLLFIGKILF